jgi:hypothetical protein
MFSRTNIIVNNKTNLNNILNNNLYDITNYNATIPDFIFLRDYVIRYFNLRITSSINIERNINRFIYNYVNQYLIRANNNSQYIYNYINNNPMYTYTKLYSNIYLNSQNIEYESNMALYQNDIVFSILNYLNYVDQRTFIQNSVFNDFIIRFSLDSTKENSFYKNFEYFVNFLKINGALGSFNKLKLLSGVNVIDFFLDLFNLEEWIYSICDLTSEVLTISLGVREILRIKVGSRDLFNTLRNILYKMGFIIDNFLRLSISTTCKR